ncbi:hypothetical protein, partial [Cohnella sp. WQ 127256]|uniref:hypothetical protein n=1 Tax=Cohnella sp. WQ 127256 TaxID=2938790 RepID=UPI0021192ADF
SNSHIIVSSITFRWPLISYSKRIGNSTYVISGRGGLGSKMPPIKMSNHGNENNIIIEKATTKGIHTILVFIFHSPDY